MIDSVEMNHIHFISGGSSWLGRVNMTNLVANTILARATSHLAFWAWSKSLSSLLLRTWLVCSSYRKGFNWYAWVIWAELQNVKSFTRSKTVKKKGLILSNCMFSQTFTPTCQYFYTDLSVISDISQLWIPVHLALCLDTHTGNFQVSWKFSVGCLIHLGESVVCRRQ